MNYSDNLRTIRERVGLTNVQMAKILDISDSLYSRYEKDKQTIPINHLNTLCNYFEVSIDYIFGFSEKKKYEKFREEINIKLASERLKLLRKENKITQDEWAESLGILRQTISNYERGKSIIATPFLYEVCKTYGVSADYLLGKIDVCKPKSLTLKVDEV